MVLILLIFNLKKYCLLKRFIKLKFFIGIISQYIINIVIKIFTYIYFCSFKKYWDNYNVKEFWDYQHPNISNNPNGGYPDTHRYQAAWWYSNKTLEEYVKDQFYNYFIELINKYKIELTQEEKDNFITYLYKNI